MVKNSKKKYKSGTNGQSKDEQMEEILVSNIGFLTIYIKFPLLGKQEMLLKCKINHFAQ